ncbi:hypothetical protein [Skermania piniformis]|uniref:Smr domain-containing protein n=1 Tax=Skermania pinensis TaxID=39122 RepID=A0ABX8SC95_9ACTN|nr:hypothetical protein [Skermania piniformis]QXQ15488.1 hypothetical protein KV203_09425 [Skermania piniformis]
MNANTRKTYTAILGHPAPRNLDWKKFVQLWESLADNVEQESGDRLAVTMNGHREVFHRPHNATVSIEDIERARHLLAASPKPKGSGTLVAVTVDNERARIITFDLDAQAVVDHEHVVDDHDPRARRLRTVERRTGRDDEHDLTGYFDDLAAALTADAADRTFVVLGHGAGKSNAAEQFVERLRAEHHQLAEHLAGVGVIDLSAASDADIEAKAVELVS